jgi:hypothetical protein
MGQKASQKWEGFELMLKSEFESLRVWARGAEEAERGPTPDAAGIVVDRENKWAGREGRGVSLEKMIASWRQTGGASLIGSRTAPSHVDNNIGRSSLASILCTPSFSRGGESMSFIRLPKAYALL